MLLEKQRNKALEDYAIIYNLHNYIYWLECIYQIRFLLLFVHYVFLNYFFYILPASNVIF